MSYILDALKKSEKERRRGTLPDMLTVQDIVAEKPKKRFVWASLLVAALLLNTGVFVWWSGFFQTKEAKIMRNAMPDVSLPSPTNDAAQGIPSKDTSTPESAEPISPAFSSVDKNIVSIPENPVSPPVENNSLRTKGTEGIMDVRKKRLPAQAVSTNEPAKAFEFPLAKTGQSEGAGSLLSEQKGRIAEIVDENKIYKIKELPSSVREDLPSFSITALMYSSNPASRMVRINDQMMYEGQDLSAGVKLEEITKDGVIFRHQKYKFYVGVK